MARRRSILITGAALSAWCRWGNAFQTGRKPSTLTRGCFAHSRRIRAPGTPSDEEDDLPAPISGSGDQDFDSALMDMLEKTSRILDVLPAFRYYDDKRDAPPGNAQAHPRRLGKDGTVYFGLHMLQTLRQEFGEHLLIAATAIGAHEFGHILQFKHRLGEKVRRGERSDRRTELQADFLAGYVAGKFERNQLRFPSELVALAIFKIGDLDVSSKHHHGTHQERRRAVEEGYIAGNRSALPLPDVIEQSTDYVLRL
jgi:hypothetical protein